MHAGDVVAVIDSHRLDIAEQRYANGTDGIDAKLTAQAADDASVREVENAKSRLAATQLKAPVSGIAGLRRVEPGNMARPFDPVASLRCRGTTNLSVVTLPEKFVEELRHVLDSGGHPAVAAWSNDDSAKLAAGVLTAMDNHIDSQTGTVTLKATFDNRDSRLYPHQFVNVHVLK
jgi:multidrug efflux system membrane fusion protein